MRRRHLVPLALAIALLTTVHGAAQIQMPYSVVGSGAAATSGPDNAVRGTVGQAAIGIVGGPSNITEIGFWYRPGWILTGVADGDVLPTRYWLGQNHPNPFNPVTTLSFSILERTRVELRVYDVTGRKVRTLVERELDPGYHRATFDAHGLPSGVYFARMTAGSFAETRKLVLLK